ncbi:TrbC/VirB2 family protein [Novosphingobium sp. 1529]|uniref:TrbC/VirB2 family protein n=1 Tax=Novosphingobium sp. 1529 TaxID=3156424 RepID=UPI003393031D
MRMKRLIERFGSSLAVFAMLLGQRALAAVPGDPQGSGVLVSAVSWLQGTLMGTVATVVAVIAIAAVGFGMLTGRINWRHGAVVVLGCFILFGAASIVGGIRAAATAGQY